VLANKGFEHVVNHIGVFFSLEESEEHSLEYYRSHNAFFIFDEFIELLSQVVKDTEIEV